MREKIYCENSLHRSLCQINTKLTMDFIFGGGKRIIRPLKQLKRKQRALFIILRSIIYEIIVLPLGKNFPELFIMSTNQFNESLTHESKDNNHIINCNCILYLIWFFSKFHFDKVFWSIFFIGLQRMLLPSIFISHYVLLLKREISQKVIKYKEEGNF